MKLRINLLRKIDQISSQTISPWLYALTIDCTNAVWKNEEARAVITIERIITIIEGDIHPIPLSQTTGTKDYLAPSTVEPSTPDQ